MASPFLAALYSKNTMLKRSNFTIDIIVILL